MILENRQFYVGMCQMYVTDNYQTNINKAEKLINEAAEKGSDFIVLPEIWNCPYSSKYFAKYAEKEGEKTFLFLAKKAKELGVYIIGGSIPELEIIDGVQKVYNTSYCFNREGELIGKHRKVHLFDVDIEGGIRFFESDVFSPGDSLTVIDTEYGKVGIGICFDIRFPELFLSMGKDNVIMNVLPAAFNMTTGPAHWELSIRMRALDNQAFFVAVSPARNMDGHYEAWGHSSIANPWGEIIAKADEKESVIVTKIDLDYQEGIRNQLPLIKSKKININYKLG